MLPVQFGSWYENNAQCSYKIRVHVRKDLRGFSGVLVALIQAAYSEEHGYRERYSRLLDSVRGFDELLESGQLQVEPLTYIRGPSLPQQYVIVDEAQNLTPHEVKTIITRCGEGAKIVLTGDPFQIDNPYVDTATNGLTVVAERLRSEALVGHILLSKGERSELANIAANKL